MGKLAEYRAALRGLEGPGCWGQYLLSESHLPGPRANLELAEAVAEEGNLDTFKSYLAHGADEAPYGSALEFLPVCGAIGLGRLVSEGRLDLLQELRRHASDPRWRVREGVAIALQRLGAGDMPALLREMDAWSRGNLLERRAAGAALCEPRLLKDAEHALHVLRLLDRVTASVLLEEDRRADAFLTLRKSLGYCWSVAVAAAPDAGKPMMEKWFSVKDKDVRWIMRENLTKHRLSVADGEWTEQWRLRLNDTSGAR